MTASLRRLAQRSSEDSPISMTSSLHEALDFTNQLSALLDKQHNDAVMRKFQQSQQSVQRVEFRVIGFGQCELVFERPGRGFVLKVAKRSYQDALWNDFLAHLRVQEAFDRIESKNCEVRVPRIFSYISQENTLWWEQNSTLFRNVHESITLPAMALVSERILPIPKIAREVLIQNYCAASSRATVSSNPANRDCLVRLYLGQRRSTKVPPPNFTLRNYNLYLDQMIELNFPVKRMATSIGEALSVLHWSAYVDGYDVEFVLGSEANAEYSPDILAALHMTSDQVAALPPHTDIESIVKVNFTRRTTRVWLLDFNLCHIWQEDTAINHPEALIDQLVEAFFENDPYYPLPLVDTDPEKELWELFSRVYLDKAKQLLRGKDRRLVNLPQLFIDGCINREKLSLEKGMPHGHRNSRQ
ncbi:zinc finger protein-domain-containing protein [Penicillium verrucosum]|uniref:zinc finger protein-domain-containing protein n=1 Tax=Penicillium verrucosum TaxID=60171 RepID=UPI002545610B|nr:zinc finger protein-domain-containing protein [Penicillium verrucosum]KAJ5921874.1 zinc finger protein-domain-containing protein [Penicillium verrucosum]